VGETTNSPQQQRTSSPRQQRQFDDREEVKPDHYDGDSNENEQAKMMRMMGFSGFQTTAGKKKPTDADTSGARVIKQQRYRQYMNRQRPDGKVKEIG
jgi:U4/U6.U5 tri-snRNP-associated protein 3